MAKSIARPWRRARCRQRRVDRPAATHAVTARVTFDEHREDQQQERRTAGARRTDVVHARERHVRRTDHERHEPVAEPADQSAGMTMKKIMISAVRRHEHVVPEMAVRRAVAVQQILDARFHQLERGSQTDSATAHQPRDQIAKMMYIVPMSLWFFEYRPSARQPVGFVVVVRAVQPLVYQSPSPVFKLSQNLLTRRRPSGSPRCRLHRRGDARRLLLVGNPLRRTFPWTDHLRRRWACRRGAIPQSSASTGRRKRLRGCAR